jgi:polyhydroxyalkanoate synthesis regulator phasin
MKKLVIFALLCVGLSASCNSDLLERVEVLENTTVVFLKSSISDLYSECQELHNEIAALEKTADQGDINALKKSLAALEAEIKRLSSLLDSMMEGYYTSEEIDELLRQMNAEITKLKSSVAELEDRIANISGTVSKMYNPPVNFHKADLKVLDIGNSYTQDAQTYLPQIIQASGISSDFSLYRAFRPSASFKTWVDCWNDADNEYYSIDFCAGTSIGGISGYGSACDGALFRKALQSVKWDIILIHQVSTYSNDYSLWEGSGAGGHLQDLIRIIRMTNPQATIGYLMTHSYRGSYWSNSEGSSFLRWKNTAEATKQLKQEYGIDFIIPYGTAVQNLRASSLNDSYEFSEDGTHLGAGLGDYVAGCCYFEALLAPRYGVSIWGNTFRLTNLDESIGGRKNITDHTAIVAQKAAILATLDMWTVSDPDDYDM